MSRINRRFHIILILASTFNFNLFSQSNTKIYRTDLNEFLESRYDSQHTFIHAKNTRHSNIECDKIGTDDSLMTNVYKPKDFLETILEVIPSETNTIIISENHVVYKSRNILLDFIYLLKEEGYSNIYIEALDYDKNLTERKYPTVDSGFYLNEPSMGNLVRELLKEGFNIFPYEQLDFQKRNSEKSVKKHIQQELEKCKIDRKPINDSQYNMELMDGHLNMSIRDYSQYKNIMQTWDANKKTIILCGHAHGIKVPYGGWRPLGYWLSSNPNVKLYSIENSQAIGQEEVELNKLTCFYDQKEPYYLLSEQDNSIYNEFRYQPYENKEINGLFDMTLFYPTNYFASEGHAIPKNENCNDVLIKSSTYKTPYLIIKYLVDEYNAEKEKAIPLDIILIDSDSETTSIDQCENEIIFIWDGKQKYELEK